MSRNDLVNFKVFLRRGDDVEVRRFSIESDAVTNFVFLREKLQSLFPVLREADFKVTWKDADNDEITVTSDDELIIALTEMKDNLKVLYVTINPSRAEADDDETPHFLPQVICDGCETVITDLRYKCIQCPDFDLCVKCESKGLHPEHIMLRFNMNQYEMPRGTGKMLHNFFRGLRKSGHAAKHHHKDKERHCKKDAWYRQEQPRRPREGGCPFSGTAKEEEVPWEGIQHIARPYVDALLQGLNAQGCGEGAEFVRNIARGIFGEGTSNDENKPEQQQTPPSKEGEKEKEKSADDKSMDVDANTIVIDDSSPSSSTTAPSAPTATPENPSHPDPLIAEGLKQLREMGFSNHAVLTELLKKHDGNLPYVIRDLLNMAK